MTDRKHTKRYNPCDEFTLHIREFIDGTLDEITHLRLEAHRIECERCSRVLAQEQDVISLMSEIPPEGVVPADFRDRVLREYRIRRDRVRDAYPLLSLKKVQIALGVFAGILLLLVILRLPLLESAGILSGTPDPADDGMEVTFTLPSVDQVTTWFQQWSGELFEGMGNVGTAMAPLTSWLFVILAISIVLGILNIRKITTGFHNRNKVRQNRHGR